MMHENAAWLIYPINAKSLHGSALECKALYAALLPDYPDDLSFVTGRLPGCQVSQGLFSKGLC